MILQEELNKDDVVEQFKLIKDCYDKLNEEVSNLSILSSDDEALSNVVDTLYNFCHDELSQCIAETEEGITDALYPIDYADDEEDTDEASERYRDSLELRKTIFD